MIAVPVELGERATTWWWARAARHRAGRRGGRRGPGARRAAVVTQAGIGVSGRPRPPLRACSPCPTARRPSRWPWWRSCAGASPGAGLSRSDVVVAVGGGVVTDLAGFAAASFHRGTAYVNVATTLLAQVDAAVGGKTGVNLPEGKNLVGAFWQPRAVLCDTEVLSTLPPREWASGRGEMAKYAFLGGTSGTGDGPDASLLDLPLEEQVARCVAIKADVVASDEREGDRRMLLNYGHTLAHALEAAAFEPGAGLDLRHGEAVAIGPGLRRPAGPTARAHRRRSGRPAPARWSVPSTSLGRARTGADPERLVSFMARDKKAQHDLTFVLDGPDGVEVVRGIDGPTCSLPWRTWRAVRRRNIEPGRSGEHAGSILLLSGPNLNLLGEREPAIYGPATLDDHVATATEAAAGAGLALEHLQTNHEGDLVEAVQRARGRAAAIIVNAGALSHTSWSLHDALAAFDGVVVELHLSNPAAREPFRHTSVIAPVADGCIAGFGGSATAWPSTPCTSSSTPGRGADRVSPAARRPSTWLPWRWPAGSIGSGPSSPRRARADGTPIGRPAGHHPGQHPVADRVQWIGRASPGHRRRGPADHRRAVPDPVRRAAGGGRGGRTRSTSASAGCRSSVRRWRPGRPGRSAPRARGRHRDLVRAAHLGGAVRPAALVPTRGWSRDCGLVKDAGEVVRMERAAAIADEALEAVLPLLAAAAEPVRGATGAHRVAVRRRPRPRHAPSGRRGERLRDHRGLGGELGQAPRPAGRPPDPARGPGGGGLRCRVRRLPVRHDPDLLRRWRAHRRAGQGVRGGGRVATGRGAARWSPGSPPARWTRPAGRSSPRRAGPSASSTAPGTASASTSTRGRRSARGRLLSSPPAPWSPWSPGCTCPGRAGSASRTPWW